MQFVGKLVTSVSDFYRDLNPATLTGAMDIIVVEDEETGERACTPFHVRIGKLHLMRPQDKRVDILINGERVEGVEMKVGEAGEAFFVVPEEVVIKGEGAGNVEELNLLSTSPLPPPLMAPMAGNVDEINLSPEKVKTSNRHVDAALSDTEVDYQISSPKLTESWLDVVEYLGDESRIKSQLFEMRAVDGGPHQVTFYVISYPLKVFPMQDFPMIIEVVCETQAKKLTIAEFMADGPDKFLDPKLHCKLVVRIGGVWWFTGRTALLVGLSCALFGQPPDPDLHKNIIFPPAITSEPIDIKPKTQMSPSQPSSWRNWWLRSTAETITAPQTPPANNIVQSPQPQPPKSELIHPSKRYLKSLRLTSEQLSKLPLKPGQNVITFTFATGRSCQSRVFLWPSMVRIVISDIDGTITKSDALGHILTFVGRDWTHSGVASLFDRISRNGYKFLYLTARAIGQAGSTREYLRGIEQDKCQLPDGPVIMSPDRLLAALRREVIIGNPEEFKIACLKDIKKLFPHPDPFYAGFGNRFTDAQSYHAVGIPPHRIFTIEPSGDLRVEHGLGYASTYLRMMDVADLFFPPIIEYPKTSIPKSGSGIMEEYQDFNFWKVPIQPADDLAAFLPPPQSTAVIAGDNIIIIEPQEGSIDASIIGIDRKREEFGEMATGNPEIKNEDYPFL